MEINGYHLDETGPSHRPAAAGVRLLRAAGRRHDGVRLLDLQRRLPRAGPQPRPGAEAHVQSDPARVGLRVAAQPPHPLQPRLGGPRGTPVVGAQEAGLVGRRDRAGGSAPTSRTSSPRSRRTTGRRPAPRAWSAIAGNQPFIMKPDGVGLALRAGHASRTARCPRTTSRSNRRWATCSTPSRRAARRCGSSRGRSTGWPTRPTVGIPGGRHHLPPHRALPERADEPLQQLAQRAAAGDVRRAEPGAGRGTRHRSRRLADGANRRAAASRRARW